MSVYTTNDDELCCPLCGETNTHLGDVEVDTPVPGRDVPRCVRLIGYCEHCLGRFALTFTAGKGVTYVKSVDLGELVAREAS